MNLCTLELNETKFESNSADVKGGAIYYGYGRPTFIGNIQYINNTAQYGPNIAGYPVKITFPENPSNKMNMEDLGSGIKYEESMYLVLRDFEDQAMVLDNQNQIVLKSINSSQASVNGFNSASLKNGIATFDNFIVSAEPGSQGIDVIASSKAIDSSKINDVFGSLIGNSIINVNLRH